MTWPEIGPIRVSYRKIIMETQLRQFIAEHIAKAKPIITELYRIHWEYDTTGDESLVERKKEVEIEYRDVYSDKEQFAKLKAIAGADGIADEISGRQMQLLLNSFQLYQGEKWRSKKLVEMSSEITSIYNHFRGKIDGHSVNDNHIKDILRHENDNAIRHKAWEASKQIGPEVAGKILEMVHLRNDNAREAGYDNYYDMSLACKEIKVEDLFATLDKLKELTDAPFSRFKSELDQELSDRFHVPIEGLYPWHYGDPFFQEVPARSQIDIDHFFEKSDIEGITTSTYHSIGLAIEDILARSDLYPKEGKCQHAFCTMIDREQKDIRVLCNIDRSHYWASTMLHEFGHAVYDKYISPELPYLLQNPAHTLSTEAIAMLMETLSRNTDWLGEIGRAPAAEIDKVARALSEQKRASGLIFIRWGLVMVHFERAIYLNPDQDLNKVWWDCVEKFQMVRRPENRNSPDWAAKFHLALAPVYYQNYLYGLLVASQLHHYIANNVGNGRLFGNRELGPYLIDRYFHSGSRMDWQSTLKQATRESLKPEYCARFTLGIE